jgi:rhamnose transport system ATP-binding protein
MTSHSEAPLLELQRARKTFGQVVALADGTVDIRAGEIHALVGENGAGKSTLVKLLAGVHGLDSGTLRLSGIEVHLRSVADSKALGISVIYQEPTLFPDLSVAENIFVGRQQLGAFGLISRRAMNQAARSLFSTLGVSINPDRPAEGLSIADQQIIEIAKAISLEAKVLIMDEPTAALSGSEVDRLFSVARSLRDKGVGILFISHRFDEVFSLSDRITVMRDGSYIGTWKASETNPSRIVKEMVGREVANLYPKSPAKIGPLVLDVKGLSRAGVFKNVSFEIHAGEIVALAGLVGAGRTEVARSVFGIDSYDEGVVKIGGVALEKSNPKASIKAGFGFVPEDRRKQGLVLDLSVGHNTALTLRRVLSQFGLISPLKERAVARQWAEKLQVKSPNLEAMAATLSGGNQQKVVLAKWLATGPKILIVDEPTRGIDVGTKAEVHRLLSDLANQGMAILMISSELPEVLGMADRIVVMREGAVTEIIRRADATPELVMHAATRSRVGA